VDYVHTGSNRDRAAPFWAAIETSSLRTAQIGASGVLLIQYRLLKCGIESAPMTTDAGIDLVAYSPKPAKAVTVQVKTCLRLNAAGGKGSLALDLWLPRNSPAELVGVVNFEHDRTWLFRKQTRLNSGTGTGYISISLLI
jgi:hypothetical protein